MNDKRHVRFYPDDGACVVGLRVYDFVLKSQHAIFLVTLVVVG